MSWDQRPRESEMAHMSFHLEDPNQPKVPGNQIGLIYSPAIPAVGDHVYVPRQGDEWVGGIVEVVLRTFLYPSPGSLNHGEGKRWPIIDIVVRELTLQ